MPTRLYWSGDNGQLYEEKDVDPGSAPLFQVWEVPDQIVLTPQQLCVQDGDLLEALLASGQAKLIRNFEP